MRPRRLARSMVDRILGGVCGGLGSYLGVNAWWVRATFIVFAIFTVGVSIALYLILWLIIPPQTLQDLAGDPMAPEQVSAETLILLGSGVVLLGIMVLAVSLGVLQGAKGDILLPFVLLGLGLVMLAQQLRKAA